MRSLNANRKNRSATRGEARPAPARTARNLSKVQPGSARRGKDAGPLARLGDSLSARLGIFHDRPMMAMCALGLVLVLLGVLAASGVIGRSVRAVDRAFSVLTADAGFGISEIHVSGNRRTPTRSIEEALAMQPGQSIFSADLVGAQARLSHLEWIASAEVHRRYPDAIFVTLVEKRPFALWQMPPNARGEAPIALVDRTGSVITLRDVEKFRRLPKLVGAGAPPVAPELVDAVQSHRAIAARIAAFSRVSQRRWNLILDDGVTVQLPETGWARQLDALEHLIIDSSILERDVTEIDLRAPTHYFFLLKNGEKKDVERGKET